MNGEFTLLLLGLLALLLLIAAVVDARSFTISNRLNLAVALLAPLYWWSIGLPLWPGCALQLALAAAVLVAFAALFYAGAMGGGDVKLAAALALWLPPAMLIGFMVIMAFAGGLLTLVLLAVHRLRRRAGRPQIPYGIAIATAGFWAIAQRFLNHFA